MGRGRKRGGREEVSEKKSDSKTVESGEENNKETEQENKNTEQVEESQDVSLGQGRTRRVG
jgi:hypothetical protein